jgi:hypothetical protein
MRASKNKNPMTINVFPNFIKYSGFMPSPLLQSSPRQEISVTRIYQARRSMECYLPCPETDITKTGYPDQVETMPVFPSNPFHGFFLPSQENENNNYPDNDTDYNDINHRHLRSNVLYRHMRGIPSSGDKACRKLPNHRKPLPIVSFCFFPFSGR